MRIVYRLRFNKNKIYIGQTSNLNRRIEEHKKHWKKVKNLKLKEVSIIKICDTLTEALAVEKVAIDHYGIENLLNQDDRDYSYIKVGGLHDHLTGDEEPDNPYDLALKLERMHIGDAYEVLQKKYKQLENRYISTFFDYQTMKENMKRMDDIIDKAIAKEFE